MVFILKYVFLGISLYILIIPILESLSTLICQGIEVLKGKLIYQQALLQQQVDEVSADPQATMTHAIGFTIPVEEEPYEEEEEE